jgi:HAD superfamily hydrolase (TIGR01509 family)
LTSDPARPSRPIEAVIFDCDGTLVDSLPLVAAVLAEYLGCLDLPCSLPEAAALFGSGRLDDSAAALEALIGRRLPPGFITELLRRRDDRVRQGLRPIDGALPLVGSLRLPIAVASNAPLAQTTLSLEVTGLLPHFASRVFSAHDVGSWKPEPGLFLHAAAALGVEASRCAVIEDSVVGIEAGLAAGMTVLALRQGEIAERERGDDEAWTSRGVVVVAHLRDVGPHLGAMHS